jgi:hypothetical protein
MQFHRRGSNPNHNIATGTISTSVCAALTRHRMGGDTVTTSKSPVIFGTRTGKSRGGAFRSLMASQKLEDFLEGFFATLAIIYFVAATTFAGVLIGNAFGS